MAPLDLAVIVAYFALTIGVGLWVSRSQATAGDYFLGARNLPAWAVLFSIVSVIVKPAALAVRRMPAFVGSISAQIRSTPSSRPMATRRWSSSVPRP